MSLPFLYTWGGVCGPAVYGHPVSTATVGLQNGLLQCRAPLVRASAAVVCVFACQCCGSVTVLLHVERAGLTNVKGSRWKRSPSPPLPSPPSHAIRFKRLFAVGSECITTRNPQDEEVTNQVGWWGT